MARYVKRPIVVEAVQWWPGKTVQGVIEDEYISDGRIFPAKCRTTEGWLGVNAGDFIITGVRGEKYPCQPDIFRETYKPA